MTRRSHRRELRSPRIRPLLWILRMSPRQPSNPWSSGGPAGPVVPCPMNNPEIPSWKTRGTSTAAPPEGVLVAQAELGMPSREETLAAETPELRSRTRRHQERDTSDSRSRRGHGDVRRAGQRSSARGRGHDPAGSVCSCRRLLLRQRHLPARRGRRTDQERRVARTEKLQIPQLDSRA